MYLKLQFRHEGLKQQAAFTLLEITIVVLILGIMAAVVMPDFSASDPAKLDLAASKIKQAIRMARNESLRTGEVHGITISQDTQIISVQKYDLTTAPVSIDYKITHPLQKQVYQYNINSNALTRGVSISNAQDAFLYSDSNRRKSLLFDPLGTPIWFFGSTDTIYQLTDGTVELSYAGKNRRISVAPLTGRVSEL